MISKKKVTLCLIRRDPLFIYALNHQVNEYTTASLQRCGISGICPYTTFGDCIRSPLSAKDYATLLFERGVVEKKGLAGKTTGISAFRHPFRAWTG